MRGLCPNELSSFRMYKVWGQNVHYGLVTNIESALFHTLDVKSAAKVQKIF